MNSYDALLDGQWSVFPWTDTEGRKANRVLGQNYKQMLLSVLHEYKLVLFLFSDGNAKERIHQTITTSGLQLQMRKWSSYLVDLGSSTRMQKR